MKGQSHEGSLSFSPPKKRFRSFPVIKDFWGSKCEYTVCAIELVAMRYLNIFIVFARNNLMNITCKDGDYILILNNINKTSAQANTQKRST